MNFSYFIPMFLMIIIACFSFLRVYKENKKSKKKFSKRQYLLRSLKDLGKIFLWLTVLMIIIFIIESLLITRLTTIDEVNSYIAQGGICYSGGDIGEINCKQFPLSSLIEFMLNIPIYYTMLFFIFIPFGSLWIIFGTGKSAIGFEIVILLITGVLWCFIILSIIYYLFSLIKKLFHYLYIIISKAIKK